MPGSTAQASADPARHISRRADERNATLSSLLLGVDRAFGAGDTWKPMAPVALDPT